MAKAKVEIKEEKMMEELKEFSGNSIDEMRKRARRLVKCSVSSNDLRDTNLSTIYVSCENRYLNIAKYVPLNTPIELEQCLIDTLNDVMINVHKQAPNDKFSDSSGMKVVRTKKYNVTLL